MSKALITPPLPNELWYRIREIQTKVLDCKLEIHFTSGKVQTWEIHIPEYPKSGRQDIRLQKSEPD